DDQDCAGELFGFHRSPYGKWQNVDTSFIPAQPSRNQRDEARTQENVRQENRRDKEDLIFLSHIFLCCPCFIGENPAQKTRILRFVVQRVKGTKIRPGLSSLILLPFVMKPA